MVLLEMVDGISEMIAMKKPGKFREIFGNPTDFHIYRRQFTLPRFANFSIFCLANCRKPEDRITLPIQRITLSFQLLWPIQRATLPILSNIRVTSLRI